VPILSCSSTDATYSDGEYGVGIRQLGDWENYRIRKYASSSVTAALGSETQILNHPPANPSSLQQYGLTTTTPITNNTWINQSTVNLVATSTDKDGDPFIVLLSINSQRLVL